MTEELLSEVVGKMRTACDGRMRLDHHTATEAGWWITHNGTRYSPVLTIPQLIYWCEAWLKGFAEATAAYENAEG